MYTNSKFTFIIWALVLTGTGFTSCSDKIDDMDPCESITCLNGGVCVDGTCDCPDGFSGPQCETEDLCITQNITCLNGGVCVDGICDCPDGYTGQFCENVDVTKIQDLLNRGVSPKSLYDAGVTLDQLYGKVYQRGIIFYLNTTSGQGLSAHFTDMVDFRGDRIKAPWGCATTDIQNLDNVLSGPRDPETEKGARIGDGSGNTEAILSVCTSNGIAAKLCRDLGDEYFLPSRGELNAMYVNLHLRGRGGFARNWYSSSSESQYDAAWVQNFDDNSTERAYKGAPQFFVRAVKSFR